MTRWSPTPNASGKILACLTSMSLKTQIASNEFEPSIREAGGTSDIVAVMESKIPNLRKDLAKLSDIALSLESKLTLRKNPLTFIFPTKETKSSLKAFLRQILRLILM